MTARVVVVVGTGTDVGKTFVGEAIVGALHRTGARVHGWKCVASGVTGPVEDGVALARATGTVVDPPLYVFREPVSLHLAARLEGAEIDVAALARAALARAATTDVLVVETAGGLFSPLSDDADNSHLVRAIAPDVVVLVAPDRLGVLHDVAATLLAAEHVGVRVDLLVLSAPPTPDRSTGTNAAEIERVLRRPVAAVFPRADVGSPLVRAAADVAASRLVGNGR